MEKNKPTNRDGIVPDFGAVDDTELHDLVDDSDEDTDINDEYVDVEDDSLMDEEDDGEDLFS